MQQTTRLPARRTMMEAMLLFGIFLAEALLFLWINKAFVSEFGGHPDEAAHFVTGLMVRDFLTGLDFSNPMRFAEQYYLHYPKVALGHWPPVLYAVMGAWMAIFPVSRISVMVLIGLIAALLAMLVYSAAKPSLGRLAGFAAAALLLALPLVQYCYFMVLTETLVTTLGFWAALRFARFIDSERLVDGLVFGVISSLAIMTRGSAWALAMLPALAILFSRRFYLLRKPALWVAAVPVLLVCVPWYVATLDLARGTWTVSQSNALFFFEAAPAFARIIYKALGLALLVPAIVGLWVKFIGPWFSKDVSPLWAVLAGYLLSVYLLQCFVPVGTAPRFMVAAVPPLLLFVVAGVEWLAARIRVQASNQTKIRWVLYAVVVIFFVIETYAPPHLYNGGYTALARQLVARSDLKDAAFLIVSDAEGEGSFIAAVALQESRPGHVVLRGTKVLSKQGWSGENYQARFTSPEALMQFLEKIPVGAVIIDHSIGEDKWRPHHELMEQTVETYANSWKLLGTFPVIREGKERSGRLTAYTLAGIEKRSPGAVELDIDLLHRTLLLEKR